MNTASIREKLYDYIRVADDKKVKAIFTMLEDDITEQSEWWKDNAVMSDLQKRYDGWESGKEKGSSLDEVDEEIARLKQKRAAK